MIQIFKKQPISQEQKTEAPQKSVRLWLAAEYTMATDLYKKHGISDAGFTRAMMAASRVQPSSVTTSAKVTALKTALKFWNAGSYQKSTELCKKYGISTKDFTDALIGSMRNT